MSATQEICKGNSMNSGSFVKKSVQEIVSELTAPGKVMIQLHGSRNVCPTFDYIFDQTFDLLEDISGIAFELDALTQIVSYVNVNEKLRGKVHLGKTFRTRIYPYRINNGLEMSIFEGFDDLDRRLSKLKVWGCSFVILQVDHGYQGSLEGKSIPLDNSSYFGIFSASVQALGMVPIIQFKYDWSGLSEEECEYIFVQTMFGVSESFHNFDVEIDGLLVSQLIMYPPMMDPDYDMHASIAALVNNLQRASRKAFLKILEEETRALLIHQAENTYTPALLRHFVAASPHPNVTNGNPKMLAMQINKIVRFIERIPWPIISGYSGNIPVITDTDREFLLNKWFNDQATKIDLLRMCNKGELVEWHPALTVLTDEFIKSHDYYNKFHTKQK